MAVLILMLLAQAGGLKWAVTHGDLAAAKAFLAVGADPNYEDNFLQTPLSHAVNEGRGDLVVLLLDSGTKPGIPFLGSGTTLIASEQTERVCLGLEIDPGYVDVIVRRWQEFSGKTAKLAETDQTFAQVRDRQRKTK